MRGSEARLITRFLRTALTVLASLLATPAIARADHPPIQDQTFFDTVFTPTVTALPAWLVVGLLPALILVLLGAAGYWVWRNGAGETEAKAEEPR